MEAMWLALSGGLAEAGDLPSEADRVSDEQGCGLLLDKNKIPCTAAIIIAPGISRPDAKLNGPHGTCVHRVRTTAGRVSLLLSKKLIPRNWIEALRPVLRPTSGLFVFE
jgi:hypothetical protein